MAYRARDRATLRKVPDGEEFSRISVWASNPDTVEFVDSDGTVTHMPASQEDMLALLPDAIAAAHRERTAMRNPIQGARLLMKCISDNTSTT